MIYKTIKIKRNEVIEIVNKNSVYTHFIFLDFVDDICSICVTGFVDFKRRKEIFNRIKKHKETSW